MADFLEALVEQNLILIFSSFLDGWKGNNEIMIMIIKMMIDACQHVLEAFVHPMNR